MHKTWQQQNSEPSADNGTKPLVRRRAAVIECCWQCPHHIHDDGTDEAKWGKHWCNKMDVEIVDADTIPEACPLPFA